MERLARPKFIAGALLLIFFAQSAWLLRAGIHDNSQPNTEEALRVGEGWKQFHGQGLAANPYSLPSLPADADFRSDASAGTPNVNGSSIDSNDFDPDHSPLLYLISAAPLLAVPKGLFNHGSTDDWTWLSRLPFLACGLFLGASLWYVARRLCTNTGGLIALALYCFSPAMIQSSAVWHTQPEMIAVWGAFGTIFTAIAVAHTLYAPREVVLWNWRRIVLLGISLALAIGTQFSMIVLVPLALVFLFYVAPVRRRAGFIIWVGACAVGAGLLFSVYFFHARTLAESLRHASFWGATWQGFRVPGVYLQVVREIERACPAMVLILPAALVTYGLWPRTRYFGNTAPLLVALLFLVLAMAHPHVAGEGFLLGAVPFLFLFVAGVIADLMETRCRALVNACVIGLIAAYAIWSVSALAHIPRG